MAIFTISIHLFLLLTIILAAVVLWMILSKLGAGRRRRKLPPGPRGLPITGCLHLLGKLPHRSLARLAKKYGPIMFMRLGSRPTVVVSSPEAAKLFLKIHDAVFAGRPKMQAFKYLTYETKGIAFTEYGPYWRNVRRLCTVELLSAAKINSFAPERKEEVGMFVRSLREEIAGAGAGAAVAVDVTAKVTELVENIMYRALFGRANEGLYDLKATIQEGTRLAGVVNLSDYFPFLAPFDLQGLVSKFESTNKAADEMLEKIIDRHIQDGGGRNLDHDHHNQTTNFIDSMLSLSNNFSTNPDPGKTNASSHHHIDRTSAKGILLDMLVGGIGSSSTTIEWVFSELLRHPRVMKKLRRELESVVTADRMVEEKDLENLPYLNMVIKEVFRLHPIGPFLVPRESMDDATVGAYFIPKGSTVLVNTWVLGTDPEIWSDNVGEFLPERFMNNNINIHGHDFELIPFGSGRRGCPGTQFAMVTVGLVMAQLLHCFDWELPEGMSPHDLDMTESFGLTMTRATHLYAVPTYRLEFR